MSMDYKLIIGCGEGRSIMHKSPISDVLRIFVLKKNRRKEFLLVSFEDFEVVQLRVFSSGMPHLVTGCSLPCVSRPCSGLIFQSKALNDEYLIRSDAVSDRVQSFSLNMRVTQVTTMFCAW